MRFVLSLQIIDIVNLCNLGINQVDQCADIEIACHQIHKVGRIFQLISCIVNLRIQATSLSRDSPEIKRGIRILQLIGIAQSSSREMSISTGCQGKKSIKSHIAYQCDVRRLHNRVGAVKPIQSCRTAAYSETALSRIRRHHNEVHIKLLFKRTVLVSRCQTVKITEKLRVAFQH